MRNTNKKLVKLHKRNSQQFTAIAPPQQNSKGVYIYARIPAAVLH